MHCLQVRAIFWTLYCKLLHPHRRTLNISVMHYENVTHLLLYAQWLKSPEQVDLKLTLEQWIEFCNLNSGGGSEVSVSQLYAMETYTLCNIYLQLMAANFYCPLICTLGGLCSNLVVLLDPENIG